MIGLNNPNLTAHDEYTDVMLGNVWTATITEEIDTLHAWMAHGWGAVGPMTIKLAIYDWETGALLGVGPEITMPDQPRNMYLWYHSPLGSRIQLIAGKRYYLCAFIGGIDFAVSFKVNPSDSINTYIFGITLDAGSGLSGLPPATLLGNVKQWIPPWSTDGVCSLPAYTTYGTCGAAGGTWTWTGTCPPDTTLAFGVCAYQAWKQFAIYGDLSGGQPSITVSPPTATIRVNVPQVLTAQVSGGTMPYAISWTNEADGSPLGTGQTINLSFPTPGVYVIRATVVDGGGLSAFATSTITVNAMPTEEPPYPLPMLPDFPPIRDPIPSPATFRFTMDKDLSGNFIIKDGATIVYTNPDPQQVLQQLITLTAAANASSLVKNLGTLNMIAITDPGTARECSLKFMENIKIYLENGLGIANINSGIRHMLKFDGRTELSGVSLRNGCIVEGINGRAKITGLGQPLRENLVYIRCGSNLQLRHLELAQVGGQSCGEDGDAGNEVNAQNNDNYFEDLYLHTFYKAATIVTEGGAALSFDGSRNITRKVLIDGESLIGARAGIFIWGENTTTVDNIFEDIEIRNIQRDGIYLCGQNVSACSRQFWRRVLVANTALQGGYSAVKLRHAVYSLFEDLTIDGGYAGLTIGTWMDTDPSVLTGDDGMGGLNDGWSRGNRFKRAIIQNCRIANLNMDIDHDGMGVEQNYVDAYIAGGGMGLWFNNGIPGSSATGVNRDNTFFVTIEALNKAISMGANETGIGGLTYRNRVTGVIKNCAIVAEIRDANCMDNYFDLVIIGGGTITDLGTRNRWNGVGKYPYGVGITPLPDDWNDGDIIINTSDNTAWYKSTGVITRLNIGDAIAQFAYMEGKGGLPAGTCQFIDKSFASGRTIVEWLWGFGDGVTSTLQNPTHNYAAKGSYNVTLRITDNLGTQTTTTQTVSIEEEAPPPATITLTVDSDGNGTVAPSGIQQLNVGTSYRFEATANEGQTFDHWMLGIANIGSTNPLDLPITADMNGSSLTAIFTVNPPAQINMTIVSDTTQGSTNLQGQQTFNVGDIVQFSATPKTGFTFKQWTLNETTYTDNPLNLPITADMNGKTITAEFTPVSPTPTVLWHTRVWSGAHNLPRLSSLWPFPIIEIYDQTARRLLKKTEG